MTHTTRAAAALALAAALAALGACGSDGPSGPSTPDPAITTTSLPDGQVTIPYEAAVNASGGSGVFTWSVVEGHLPPGLALSFEDLSGGDDLLITGVPETEGSYSFQLRLLDEDGRSDTTTLAIDILPAPAPLAIGNPAIPPALAGSPYTVQLRPAADDAGSLSWRIVGGSLPAGLAFGQDGAFSGTPTETGAFDLTIEVSNGAETATGELRLVVVAHRPGRYDITPFPVVPVPSNLEDNLRAAIDRLEAAITGDLPLTPVEDFSAGPGFCGGFGEELRGTAVDDILIMVNIDLIDGPGQTLAQAGPCLLRDDGFLTYAGILILDETDLEAFETEERVTDIIQHEMAHVIGFGTLWELDLDGPGGQEPVFDLLRDDEPSDTLTDWQYVGDAAVAEYQAAGGTRGTIPVEDDGGPGSAKGHWDEDVFGSELMTPEAERSELVDIFFSRMSIASFADLGYTVNPDAADDQPLLGSVLATEPAGRAGRTFDDLLRGPVIVTRPDGRFRVIHPNPEVP